MESTQQKKQYVSFKVDGEFVCDMARAWFWNEDKPFKKCEELLLSCLMTDEIGIEEKKKIVIEILEGRKKLVGINELSLVDDNRQVRPLTDKIEEYRKREIIQKIRDDIEFHPLSYIDEFSCPKNPDDYEEVDNFGNEYERELYEAYGAPLSEHTKIRAWVYSTSNNWINRSRLLPGFWKEESYLDNGLFLLSHEKIVFELFGRPASEVGRDEFYKRLYDYLKEREGGSNEIQIRNQKYVAFLRSTNSSKKADESLNQKPEPDDLLSEYGLIDREGNYYSCMFAGHHVKAQCIIENNRTRFGFEEQYVSCDKALDTLYNLGWAIIRNPNIGGAVFLDYDYDYPPTKKQIDKMFDHMIRFKEHKLRGIERYMEI